MNHTNMYLPAYPCALHCVSCEGTKVKCACVYFRKYASIRGLTENWRIYRLFSGIRRKYNSLVCLHEFITLYCCMLQYFHCNFVYIVFHVPIRLNPEKIFEELQACPKEVCVIYFFRLVCAIRPW